MAGHKPWSELKQSLVNLRLPNGGLHRKAAAEFGRRHGKTIRLDEDLALGQIIFVFGSNLGGHHGAGAAADAKKYWGAKYLIGVGLAGNSYAIPTKDENIETLPLHIIRFFVRHFLHFAKANPDLEFQVTAIGCGLAGYTSDQIAPLFVGAPWNVHLPLGWRKIIQEAF